MTRARLIVPRYGIAEPVSNADIARLLEAHRIKVYNVGLQDCIAYLTAPDEDGNYGLRMRADVGGGVRRFFQLHDLEHVMAGEADEATREDYDDPYPHFERRADLFAAQGVLHMRDRQLDREGIERALWREVPAQVPSWKYRVPEIATALAMQSGELHGVD